MNDIHLENGLICYQFDITPVPALRLTRGQMKLIHALDGRLTKQQLQVKHKIKRYLAFKTSFAWLAASKRFTFPESDVKITFIMPTKEKERWGQPHQFAPDLDNLLKAVKDACCKRDEHIWDYGGISKVWGEKGMISIITRPKGAIMHPPEKAVTPNKNTVFELAKQDPLI